MHATQLHELSMHYLKPVQVVFGLISDFTSSNVLCGNLIVSFDSLSLVNSVSMVICAVSSRMCLERNLFLEVDFVPLNA